MAKLSSVRVLQDVSNVLYGLAESGQQLRQDQFDCMMAVAARKDLLDEAAPQSISNIIWSAAVMKRSISERQLQQLVVLLCNKLADAKPHTVSNTLWAVATMQQGIADQQLYDLVTCFGIWLANAQPQHISNILWALARLNHPVSLQLLQRLEVAFISQLSNANAITVSNFLWACGELQYFPQQLLTVLQEQQIWRTLLPVMEPEGLSQVASALGALGHGDDGLMAAVIQQARSRMNQQPVAPQSTIDTSSLVRMMCNICWSVAVSNMQQLIPEVLSLLRFCAGHFKFCEVQSMQQLQQVHLWLKDVQQSNATGLSSVLSDKQLSCCEAAWKEQLQQYARQDQSTFHREVFTTLQQLPLTWHTPPVMEQLCDPDGMFSIDISGVTADGVRLAIEADGPTHFRRPDNKLTGSTLYRNRALAARGYVVVSVPYFEWNERQVAKQKQHYLLSHLQQQMASNMKHQQKQQPCETKVKAIVVSDTAALASKQQPSQRLRLQHQQHQQQQPQAQPVTATGRIRRIRRREDPGS